MSERILIVDDEQIIREVIENILNSMGCAVDCAQDGAAALELFQQSLQEGKPYDAMLLDLTIHGGMGGKEVVRHMRSIDPSVKAVVLSGYSTDPVFVDFKQHGFAAALQKPFQVDEFKSLISRLLD